MAQEPIGQRIKFLITSLNLSVRKFAHALDIGETNIRNYIDRGTKPSSDVLEKIVYSFPQVNMVWLLTGQGEPYLPDDSQSGTTQTGSFNVTGHGNKQSIKGNVQANSGGKNAQNINLDDCKQALQDSQREVEFLQGQVKLQQEVIAAKEETITLLRASFNRPN